MENSSRRLDGGEATSGFQLGSLEFSWSQFKGSQSSNLISNFMTLEEGGEFKTNKKSDFVGFNPFDHFHT